MNNKLFDFLFNKKQKSMQEKTTEVAITSYSQPHVLRHRMSEQKMTHGETVTANISPVRLESSYGKMIMYFCPMNDIEVVEKFAAGDGGSLPADAIVDGLSVPGNFKPGLYTLKNVKLSSNGTMQVIATEKTVFEDYDTVSERCSGLRMPF